MPIDVVLGIIHSWTHFEYSLVFIVVPSKFMVGKQSMYDARSNRTLLAVSGHLLFCISALFHSLLCLVIITIFLWTFKFYLLQGWIFFFCSPVSALQLVFVFYLLFLFPGSFLFFFFSSELSRFIPVCKQVCFLYVVIKYIIQYWY